MRSIASSCACGGCRTGSARRLCNRDDHQGRLPPDLNRNRDVATRRAGDRADPPDADRSCPDHPCPAARPVAHRPAYRARGRWRGMRGPGKTSIAVLPFVDLLGDPRQTYFADGIAEELRDALGRLPKLKAIARPLS